MAYGNIVIVWDGPGTLNEGVTVIAGPGDKVRLTSAEAEAHVRAGKAHYPRN